MLAKDCRSNELDNPVAILDNELRIPGPFQTAIFELCTVCGAKFRIGYFGESKKDLRVAEDLEELPRRLIEILAKDHRREREHKGFIELDI